MLMTGYKLNVASGVDLNERSVVPWPEVAARALLRTGAELRRMWLQQHRAEPERSERLRFVVEPLKVPSVVTRRSTRWVWRARA